MHLSRYMWLQGVTIGCMRLEGGYKGLQGVQGATMGYRGVQGVTGGCKRLQGLTGSYHWLQGVTRGYKGLQEVTWGYRGFERGLCQRTQFQIRWSRQMLTYFFLLSIVIFGLLCFVFFCIFGEVRCTSILE